MLLSGLLPIYIRALPQISEVISGDVKYCRSDSARMVIQAEDRSIIQYQNFNVALGETVRFVQPSAAATVLNRVIGADPSEILGKIQSNGKVFLVNPRGVYFGKEAEVDVGSLIASTLDLSNADFLNDRFEFASRKGMEEPQVINLGTLRAKEGGFIALLSPAVRNEGVIVAEAGKVLLASGETVILDLEGTGLMHFAVEGTLLEKAMIEQAGRIEALQGQVRIAMSDVRILVKQVINADHILEATDLIKEKGVIRLASGSVVKAGDVAIAANRGSSLKIEGALDTSNKEGIGGKVHLFAESILLENAKIDACGTSGGGEVLIGGDLHGEDFSFHPGHVEVDSLTSISSDALVQGNGGKVVVWSDQTTLFNGKISSKGGPLIGDGGLVETSGHLNLNIELGQVITSAPFGKTGLWLLDPLHIEIVENITKTTLSEVASCLDTKSHYTNSGLRPLGGISNAVINESTTPVVLCATSEGGTITVSAPIHTEVDITFIVPPSGSIVLNKSVVTKGGAISIEGPAFVGTGLILLDTTSNGIDPGADITFGGSLDGGSSAANLCITAGIGEVVFKGGIGKGVPLQAFTITSGSEVVLGSDLITNSNSTGVMISPSLLLMGNVKIDTTKSGLFKGAPILLRGGVNGTHRLFLNAGTSEAFLGASGLEIPLAALQMKAGHIGLRGDVAASGGTMIFEGPVSILADLSLTDTGPTGIIFEGVLDCCGSSYALTLTAPIGKVAFLADVGSTLPPENLTVSSHLIRIGGNVTAVSGLTLNNAVELLTDVTVSAPTTIFADTVDGSYNLTLDATSGGTITMGNIVGSITPLGNLIIRNVNTLSAQGIYSETITQEAGTGVSVYADFLNTTGAGGISLTAAGGFEFSGGIQTLNGGSFLIQTPGSVTVISGTDIALSNQLLCQGGGPVYWEGNITTEGGDISFSGPFHLLGPVLISSGNTGSGEISFLDTIDGAYSLFLSAGLGDISFGAAIGSVTPLQDIVLAGAQNTTAAEINSLSYTQLAGYGTATYAGNITTAGSLGISITSNYVAFAGATGGKTLTTTNGNMLINSVLGGINSLANPVAIDVDAGLGTLFVGSASPAYFSGTLKTLCAARSNVPCYINYNGTEYTPTTCCVSP